MAFEVMDYKEITTKELVIKATLEYKDGICMNRNEVIQFSVLDDKIKELEAPVLEDDGDIIE